MWIAAALISFLPGLAWLVWQPDDGEDSGERLAGAVGLSISLVAILALAFFVLHISLSAAALIILFVLAGLAGLAGILRNRRSGWNGRGWLLALAAFAVLTAWRLYQARTLVLPAWVDSLHHVLIVRKMLEAGGLPATLDPYLPVPFYYHYGFHAIAAVFAFFSRFSPDQAVLVFGQALNAAVCLSVYRLGKALWQDAYRAAAAAALVGFFTTMPAYYLTWGRYTLLTGLILLPWPWPISTSSPAGRSRAPGSSGWPCSPPASA
ncbi:MAG TPA: hypothetical protein VMT46_03485 [Anaerolineaceae bacterium]|nr:hypothetical protein [Anaerolineaceae bacterium]